MGARASVWGTQRVVLRQVRTSFAIFGQDAHTARLERVYMFMWSVYMFMWNQGLTRSRYCHVVSVSQRCPQLGDSLAIGHCGRNALVGSSTVANTFHIGVDGAIVVPAALLPALCPNLLMSSSE